MLQTSQKKNKDFCFFKLLKHLTLYQNTVLDNSVFTSISHCLTLLSKTLQN